MLRTVTVAVAPVGEPEVVQRLFAGAADDVGRAGVPDVPQGAARPRRALHPEET
ncbi:hypothetical protein GCM10020221_20680 [Streptomyces thioluteus]|uniref:Uncharacterized protein n=1 Tax=Streptomyces thioluteus TaxID=66431 RepID=A0ABN3WT32_STRTU